MKTHLLLPCSALLAVSVTAMSQAPNAVPVRALTPSEIYKDIESLDDSDGSVAASEAHVRKQQANKQGGAPQGQIDGPTVIHAEDSEYMEQQHEAVFQNSVVVNNASFNLVCDKLTALMHHDDAAKPAASKTASTPVPTPSGGPQKGAVPAGPNTGALEKAIAEGAVEVTQDKVDDNGNIQHSIGHGKKMIYEVPTGKVTLYGKPDLQQGDQLCVALAESTVMVLHRNGHMEVFGPHEMVITERKQEPNSPQK